MRPQNKFREFVAGSGRSQMSTSMETGHHGGDDGTSVCMATFNGETYVGRQLESILDQLSADDEVIVVDDCSTDGTIEAVRRLNDPRIAVHVNDRNRREVYSFSRAISLARHQNIFLSDQDDVWLPEKLAHAASALKQVVESRPALYFCARTLVDSELRPIGPGPALRRPPGFPTALTQNVIPGCCMILNRAAAELIDAAQAPDRTWHDWWCYLVVSAGGGLVIRGDSPDILYRQHAGNLVGEPLRFWRRTVAAMRRGEAVRPLVDPIC